MNRPPNGQSVIAGTFRDGLDKRKRYSMQFRHPPPNRRALLVNLAMFATTRRSLASFPISFADEWRAFKSRFLSKDGRIIDTGNGGVSHSEGQGWGLLFAVAARDQESFDLILNWTAHNLVRPSDSLHAWRYVPMDRPPVKDANNAADGDMFIATALLRAGRLWGLPDHLLTAAAIGRDILRLLVREVGPYTLLLPGVEGFETKNAIFINPSYYAFPMMTELATVVPSAQWDRLQRDGKILIDVGRFGRWSLPPDWLQIAKTDAALSPAPGWPPRFSYDAIRIPLWWVWQKLQTGPAIEAIEQFWRSPPPNLIPAWVDLKTNEIASYQASLGVISISRLIGLASGTPKKSEAPMVEDSKSYYDASLILLSHIAEHEMFSS